MTVRLDEDEIWAVLAASHTGILTTLRRDGSPVALPVWFVALEGRVFVSGPADAKRVARIGHDPRCSFLVESGDRWSELRAVHLNGLATVLTDKQRGARVSEALDEKYRAFRTSHGAMADATRAHYEVELATIEIVPIGRTLSWDNSRVVVKPEDESPQP